jgi:hypothetical protein
MANRNFDHPWVLGKRIVQIGGSFDTNGSSSPVATKGLGFTVTRTGVGTYALLTSDPYLDVNSAMAELQLPTASLNAAYVGPISGTNSTTGVTVTLYTQNVGGLADIAANANSRVHFLLVLRDSTVGQSKP